MRKEEKSETLFIDKVRNNCEEVALKCTALRIAVDALASYGVFQEEAIPSITGS